MYSFSSSSGDVLGSIKGQPVKLGRPHKVWPQLVCNLFRAIPSLPTSRRALLIGINYSTTLWRTRYELAEPQEDVVLMKDYLIEHAKWSEDEIVVLTDAKGTPNDLLPTHSNIMRELKEIRDSNCRSVFFLYTGHSDQRSQPEPEGSSRRPQREGAPGRIDREENDQFIIPVDAVAGHLLKNIHHDLIVLDDVLHDYLIANLPVGSTFLAVLDTCHSATLLDLKHHRCNRTHGFKTRMKRVLRKVVVEPYWFAFGGATSENIAKVNSFNSICNGFCPRRKRAIYPIAVAVSACKDRQQVFENGSSLTRTLVSLLKSNPSTSLCDVIDTVLINYDTLQRQMKELEKYYKHIGDEEGRRAIAEKRKEAKGLVPQISSSGALDLRRPHSGWSPFTVRPDSR